MSVINVQNLTRDYGSGKGEHMVTIYAAYTGNLPDPALHPELLEELGVERREKTLGYRLPEDRKLSLGAGLLQREIFSRYHVEPSSLYEGVNGKPLSKEICFSLSHSGEQVILAVSEDEVGCDIEKQGEARTSIAKRFFTTGEQKFLESFSTEEERDKAFLRLWTARESYMKMTGEGMRLPLREFEARLWEPGRQVIYREGHLESCYWKEYELPGYQIALCSRRKEAGELEVIHLEWG